MELLDHNEIQTITGGDWISPPICPREKLRKGAFDTRSLNGAQIFFCWNGESNDGHQYAGMLAETSVRLIIVEKPIPEVAGVAILLVPDSLVALHKLAAALIKRFSGKIVNITGSSGKTTAKTWLTHLLRLRFNVLANVGNFNNHIGCPITILNLKPEHDLALLEMGTSGLGELELLSSIAPSDIAVLLNVGHAHLGKFGSLENTYKAKLEIFSHQKENAIAVIPFEDERIRDSLTNRKTVYFGRQSPMFAWKSVDVDPTTLSQRLSFVTPFGQKEINVPTLGAHVGQTLSALFAVCWSLGMSWEEMEKSVSDLPMEKGRSTFIHIPDGSVVLDDTYNANPESVINMLETICQLQMTHYVGIIGNLAELEEGLSHSAAYIRDHIPAKMTDLYLLGDSGRILEEIIQEKYQTPRCVWISSMEELLGVLREIVRPNSVIGIKGSRSAHMERAVYALLDITVQCDK